MGRTFGGLAPDLPPNARFIATGWVFLGARWFVRKGASRKGVGVKMPLDNISPRVLAGDC